MIETLKSLIFPLLKVSETPPVIPAGHDNDRFLRVVRAAPAFLKLRWLMIGLYFLSIALPLIFSLLLLWVFSPVTSFPLFLLGILALVFFAVKTLTLAIVAKIEFDMRWYIVTDASLRVRSGVWTIRETTLSFHKIQNIRVQQGPVERLFGISTIVVETAGGGGAAPGAHAGGGGHQAVLRGLDHPLEVRDHILTAMKAVKTQGVHTQDNETQHKINADFGDALALLAKEISAFRTLWEHTKFSG